LLLFFSKKKRVLTVKLFQLILIWVSDHPFYSFFSFLCLSCPNRWSYSTASSFKRYQKSQDRIALILLIFFNSFSWLSEATWFVWIDWVFDRFTQRKFLLGMACAFTTSALAFPICLKVLFHEMVPIHTGVGELIRSTTVYPSGWRNFLFNLKTKRFTLRFTYSEGKF